MAEKGPEPYNPETGESMVGPGHEEPLKVEPGEIKTGKFKLSGEQEKIGPEQNKSAEGEVTPEKDAKASEVIINVELWKSLGREVDTADVEAKIRELPELEDDEAAIYIPQDLRMSDLEDIYKVNRLRIWKNPSIDLDQIKMPRRTEEGSYAISFKWQQEPDSDTIGKSAKHWSKEKGRLMDPLERIVAGFRYERMTGRQMDHKHNTLCPDSIFPLTKGEQRVQDEMVSPHTQAMLRTDLPSSMWGELGKRTQKNPIIMNAESAWPKGLSIRSLESDWIDPNAGVRFIKTKS